MTRFLILGAQGQLGADLQSTFHDAGLIAAHGRATCDLSDATSIRNAIRESRPDVILNAAAYTAVDRAESEPKLAMHINGDAPGILAEEAKKMKSLLVHYSTDYVFDGSKRRPWTENDPLHPLNVYGATKLAGERNIQQVGGDFLIFRTSWVFSPRGNNFLRTMLRLGQERDELQVVDDQKGAPTSASALALATRKILSEPIDRIRAAVGIYHMTCNGETTWFNFAKAIFAAAPLDRPWASLKSIASSEYPTPATRPMNSVLSTAKLVATFGVELPSWRAALSEVLLRLRMNN